MGKNTETERRSQDHNRSVRLSCPNRNLMNCHANPNLSEKDGKATVSSDDATDKDGIIIRLYEDKDRDQVLALFRKGMESSVPTFTRNVVTDPFLFLIVTGIGSILPYGVVKALSMLSIMGRNDALVTKNSSSPLGTWLASALGSVGAVIVFTLLTHVIGACAIDSYIKTSIASDLSDIPGHYFKQGGVFLVAESASTGRVVGCVGGQRKADELEKQMFELRRMSVDPTVQRCGLGRRLIQSLEDELQKVGCRQICLFTTSILVGSAFFCISASGGLLFSLHQNEHQQSVLIQYRMRRLLSHKLFPFLAVH